MGVEMADNVCGECDGTVEESDGSHYEYPNGRVAHWWHPKRDGAVLVITRVELHAVSIDTTGTGGTARYDPEFSIVRD